MVTNFKIIENVTMSDQFFWKCHHDERENRLETKPPPNSETEDTPPRETRSHCR